MRRVSFKVCLEFRVVDDLVVRVFEIEDDDFTRGCFVGIFVRVSWVRDGVDFVNEFVD